MINAQPNPRSLPAHLAIRLVPLVRRIAANLARRLPRDVQVDDLASAGLLALVTSYQRFDPTRGEDFFTFAAARVRGAMTDELRALDPLSRDLRAMARRVDGVKHALEAHAGATPSEGEIATELGVPLEQYQVLRSHLNVSAPVRVVELDSIDTTESLPDLTIQPVDEQLAGQHTVELLRAAIKRLPANLHHVVTCYYDDGRTLRDIGIDLGVSESRVCQLRSEAVKRLRSDCGQELAAAA